MLAERPPVLRCQSAQRLSGHAEIQGNRALRLVAFDIALTYVLQKLGCIASDRTCAAGRLCHDLHRAVGSRYVFVARLRRQIQLSPAHRRDGSLQMQLVSISQHNDTTKGARELPTLTFNVAYWQTVIIVQRPN